MTSASNVMFLFSFFVLLISCNVDNQSGNSVVDVIEISSFEEIKSADWFEIKKYIPLNAKNASDYLYRIGKVRFLDEHIYVLQLEGNGVTVFKFSNDGRMIGSINGPTSLEKNSTGLQIW